MDPKFFNSSSSEIMTSFQLEDTLVMASLLGISLVIGLYFYLNQKYQKTDKLEANSLNSEISYVNGSIFEEISTKKMNISLQSYDDFHFASKQLTFFPTSCSLTASFMSALTMIGWPTEFFVYGSMFLWFSVAYFIAAFISGYFFIPYFHCRNYNTTFDFMTDKFSSKFLTIATKIVFLLQSTMYSGIVIYAPSLAISTVVDGITLNQAMLVTTIVCTVYTSLGGLKAVIWTDVIQLFVMFSGFLLIIGQGLSDFSFSEIISKAQERNITSVANFEWNLKERHSFLSVVIGGAFGMWLPIFAVNQTMVQRYMSCKNVTHARLSIALCVINLWILLLFGGFSGYVMNAYHSTMPGLAEAFARKKTDKYIPILIKSIFDRPGFMGWFTASIYAGTLSTVSSSIASMATVTISRDSILSSNTLISKLTVVIFGGCCLGAAYLAQSLGGVLEAAMSINSIMYAPLFSLFCLGIFSKVKKMTASMAYISGILIGIILYVISTMCRNNHPDYVHSFASSTTYHEPQETPVWYCHFYLSYLFIPCVALLTTISIGVVGHFFKI